MTNIALSRTERVRRRCDVDDLVAIATALAVPPAGLLPLWAGRIVTAAFAAPLLDGIEGALHG